MKRMACALAFAAGAGLTLGGVTTPVLAEPLGTIVASGLQIAIATPDVTDAGSTTTLDVTFRGGNLRSVELFVDGGLVKRQGLRTRDGHGVVSFALESALLTEGGHEIVVKAVDFQGNIATATTRLRVAPDPSNAAARFAFPKRNSMVQGVVPIELKLDPSIRNPYVTFLIDNDFLAFTNYAPYTYNWDSAHAANGSHSIGVEVYDGETLAKVKTLEIKVVVNNPGGFTNRQNETPDLNRNGKASAPVVQIARETAQSALPNARLDAQVAGAELLRGHLATAMTGGAGLRRGGEPVGYRTNALSPASAAAIATPHLGDAFPEIAPLTDTARLARTLFPAAGQPYDLRVVTPDAGLNLMTARAGLAAPDSHSLAPAPKAASGLRLTQPGLMAALANPTEIALRPLADSGVVGLARQSLRLRRAGNMAARPALQYASAPVVAANVHSKPIVGNGVPAPAGKSLVGAGLLTGLRAGRFDIAFDNSRIAFDVAPRVAHGMPLAPFRQIFEHTGGKVEWFNQSKTVHAYNNAREIEFRVGQTQAKVNNQPVTLDAKPYIQQGRAIVPLSFVRDALDVKITFDAQTGRLLIESKR